MTERLTEDIYMLINLTVYLEIALDYEDNKYCGQLSSSLKLAQGMLQEVIAGLANMTGVSVEESYSQLASCSGAHSSSEDETGGETESTTTAGQVRAIIKILNLIFF